MLGGVGICLPHGYQWLSCYDFRFYIIPPLFSLTLESCPPLPWHLWVMSPLAVLPGWWTLIASEPTPASGSPWLQYQFLILHILLSFSPFSFLVALTCFLCCSKLFHSHLGDDVYRWRDYKWIQLICRPPSKLGVFNPKFTSFRIYECFVL